MDYNVILLNLNDIFFYNLNKVNKFYYLKYIFFSHKYELILYIYYNGDKSHFLNIFHNLKYYLLNLLNDEFFHILVHNNDFLLYLIFFLLFHLVKLYFFELKKFEYIFLRLI